jgi:hypothetical protein
VYPGLNLSNVIVCRLFVAFYFQEVATGDEGCAVLCCVPRYPFKLPFPPLSGLLVAKVVLWCFQNTSNKAFSIIIKAGLSFEGALANALSPWMYLQMALSAIVWTLKLTL